MSAADGTRQLPTIHKERSLTWAVLRVLWREVGPSAIAREVKNIPAVARWIVEEAQREIEENGDGC